MQLITQLPLLDEILEARREMLGAQYQPYKNHVYRMVNFCLAFHPCTGDDLEKIIIAACFHDLGIWPNDVVDYLPPSIELARAYLEDNQKHAWVDEISEMIDQHHKFRAVKNSAYPLVEIFRRGDWTDVSFGLRAFGLDKGFYKQVCAHFPNLGFHKNLMLLSKEEFKRHPLNPLPMMRW